MIRVKATTAVCGMHAGDEYEMDDNDYLRQLIGWGHLILLSEDKVDEEPAVVETLPDPVHLEISKPVVIKRTAKPKAD